MFAFKRCRILSIARCTKHNLRDVSLEACTTDTENIGAPQQLLSALPARRGFTMRESDPPATPSALFQQPASPVRADSLALRRRCSLRPGWWLLHEFCHMTRNVTSQSLPSSSSRIFTLEVRSKLLDLPRTTRSLPIAVAIRAVRVCACKREH